MDNDAIHDNSINDSLEKKQMVYFFSKWIAKKSKEKMLSDLKKEDVDFMWHTLALLNISPMELASYKPSSVVDSLLSEISKGDDSKLDDLQKAFINNFENILTEYLNKIKSFQIESLPSKQRECVEKLIKNGKNDRVELILSNHSKKNNTIIQLKNGIQQFNQEVNLFDVHVFTCNALNKNPQLIKRLKYAIDNPVFLMPVYVDEILLRKKPSISQWYLYRKLSIPEYKEFTTKLDDQQQWQRMYNEAVKSIKQKLDIPILAIVKRKELIESLFYNCKKQFYGTALIVIFPLIEGLLWDIARQVGYKKEIFGKEKNELYDCETNEIFLSERIRDVIERTAVKKNLDSDFIKEFCEELYEERNPVLHGNSVCQYDCNNISICFVKKLFVLDYLLNVVEKVFEEQLFDSWDSAFTSDKIDEFIAKYCDQ